MKWAILALSIGVLFIPLQGQEEYIPDWCFHSEYDSIEQYQLTTPPASNVFIKIKGKKVLVYTKHVSPPLPHCIEPLK